MSREPCPHTAELLAAARCGAPDSVAAAHAATCRECADALLVGAFLTAESTAAAAEARPPDPAVVLWRVRRERRRAAAERALRPIAIWERIAAVAALAGAAVFGAAALGSLGSDLGALAASAGSDLAAALPLAAAALLLAVAGAGAYWAWMEE
jgi:hypothetical protein